MRSPTQAIRPDRTPTAHHIHTQYTIPMVHQKKKNAAIPSQEKTTSTFFCRCRKKIRSVSLADYHKKSEALSVADSQTNQRINPFGFSPNLDQIPLVAVFFLKSVRPLAGITNRLIRPPIKKTNRSVSRRNLKTD